MRLNKHCPAYEYCKAANDKIDVIWRYGCPKWVGAKKTAPFDQCMRHEEYKDAIRNRDGTAGEHQE